MKFNINDRVRVKTWDELSEGQKSRKTNGDPRLFSTAKAKCCGLIGTITDVMYSVGNKCYTYVILFDGHEDPSRSQFTADCLECYVDPKTEYKMECEEDDVKIILHLIEIIDGEEREIESQSAFKKTADLEGFVQAISFASNMIYRRLYGGND